MAGSTTYIYCIPPPTRYVDCRVCSCGFCAVVIGWQVSCAVHATLHLVAGSGEQLPSMMATQPLLSAAGHNLGGSANRMYSWDACVHSWALADW
mmetsp:Transcript_33306/g.94375  ORF Transcript_33306/g.94375 Transcript_33306/m.94375 type:complete len:94 (-) Transcript_33306:1562-1843(-)